MMCIRGVHTHRFIKLVVKLSTVKIQFLFFQIFFYFKKLEVWIRER